MVERVLERRPGAKSASDCRLLQPTLLCRKMIPFYRQNLCTMEQDSDTRNDTSTEHANTASIFLLSPSSSAAVDQSNAARESEVYMNNKHEGECESPSGPQIKKPR